MAKQNIFTQEQYKLNYTTTWHGNLSARPPAPSPRCCCYAIRRSRFLIHVLVFVLGFVLILDCVRDLVVRRCIACPPPIQECLCLLLQDSATCCSVISRLCMRASGVGSSGNISRKLMHMVFWDFGEFISTFRQGSGDTS